MTNRVNGRGRINIGGQTGYAPGHWKADPPAPRDKVLPSGPPPARLLKVVEERVAALNADLRALRLRGFEVEVFLGEEIAADRSIPILVVEFREPAG